MLVFSPGFKCMFPWAVALAKSWYLWHHDFLLMLQTIAFTKIVVAHRYSDNLTVSVQKCTTQSFIFTHSEKFSKRATTQKLGYNAIGRKKHK
jgi:hypothetical protein